MATRDTPYGAFNFLVDLNGTELDGGEPFGGFSDVSGLGTEITVAEYRNGNEKREPRPQGAGRAQGQRRHAEARHRRLEGHVGLDPGDAHAPASAAKRDVSITLRDEAGRARSRLEAANVIPMKYTGPTLAAKGGGDVAMEELVLAAEGMVIEK